MGLKLYINYQKILLSRNDRKIKITEDIKNSFEKENIGKAFDVELKKFLEDINPIDVPDNLTSFYYTNITIPKDGENDIKFNKVCASIKTC